MPKRPNGPYFERHFVERLRSTYGQMPGQSLPPRFVELLEELSGAAEASKSRGQGDRSDLR